MATQKAKIIHRQETPTFKIVIKKIEEPFSRDIDDDIAWICKTFGLFEPIDKEKTASTIFREIIKGAEENKFLTSTQISQRIQMSRGAVINHLNKLLRANLIVRHGRHYLPASKSIYRTVKSVEEQIEAIFRNIERVARFIDKEFGIEVDD